MEAVNNILLNRLFTRNTFKALIEHSDNETYYAAIRKYIRDPEGKSHFELISEIYQILDKKYRNEYFFKNTLLNKLLLGVHSPTTTTALTEVPVHKSKADFILINGKAVVYEIKTELDNFERLASQLQDYYKAFSTVCVVASESNFAAINKRLANTNVGLYVLTKKDTVSLKKKPIADCTYLDSEIIFKILRKVEYENIIKNYFGFLPKVSQFSYYSECKNMFKAIRAEKAHEMFIKELKKRKKIDIHLFSNVPKELKNVVYFSNYQTKDYERLQRFLLAKFGG